MLIIPAIDIKDGKVVRLSQGKFTQEKVYSQDPVAVAKKWHDIGALRIHLVDLDGALKGELKNLDVLRRIKDQVNVPVEFGGGIRTLDAVERVFEMGADYVILGTKACEDEAMLKEILKRHNEKTIISIDAKGGFVATDGWTKVSDIKAIDLAKKVESLGARVIIYTDISKDGMMKGPNLEAIENMLGSVKKLLVIASGGVSSLVDLMALKQLEAKGLYGVIIGKALYENKISLEEALEIC